MKDVVRFGKMVLLSAVLMVGMSPAFAAEKAAVPAAPAVVENELGLTPEQQAKIKTLREDFRTRQDAMVNDLKMARAALQHELDSVSPSRKKADELALTVTKEQTQLLTSRIDHVFALRAVLTPEQYQKLIQIRDKHKDEVKAKGGKTKKTKK